MPNPSAGRTMSVFSNAHFDDHEHVVYCFDAASGLRAIIAIHNTHLGPALGGCRVWPYGGEDEALVDVLRLSRGMTYKAALADLQQGGGKSVIIADPRHDKTADMMRAMGRFVDSLGGRYIVAEDSGTSVDDMRLMRESTSHVGGLLERTDALGRRRSGDPSPATAYGAFIAVRAAVARRLQRQDLRGLRVAVQGVGNVGARLARHLHEAGAQLWVCDHYPERARKIADELGATVVAPAAIYEQPVDVLCPCALGAVLNDETIPKLRAKVVAGAANNQLAEDRHGRELMRRGILYAPDYVVNAGGIIDIAYERDGAEWARVQAHLERIGDTLTAIFERSERDGEPTNEIADRLARERFAGRTPSTDR